MLGSRKMVLSIIAGMPIGTMSITRRGPRTVTSKNHVRFIDSHEYGVNGLELFHGADGTLYRAPRVNPIDIYGYRQGARFECQPREDNHEKFIATQYLQEEQSNV